MLAPILAQDRARTLIGSLPCSPTLSGFPVHVARLPPAPLSIFRRAIVDPGMNFETTGAFGAAIGENIVRPPAFKISAAPDRDMLHVREFERAIDPTAASPLRRRDRPVRMIVE